MSGSIGSRGALPHWLNESQGEVLRSYRDGEFADMLQEQTADGLQRRLVDCGDGLLRFLMVELAESEGADSLEEGLRRTNAAVEELRAVADALAGRIFNQAAG